MKRLRDQPLLVVATSPGPDQVEHSARNSDEKDEIDGQCSTRDPETTFVSEISSAIGKTVDQDEEIEVEDRVSLGMADHSVFVAIPKDVAIRRHATPLVEYDLAESAVGVERLFDAREIDRGGAMRA